MRRSPCRALPDHQTRMDLFVCATIVRKHVNLGG
jgi:hypothetical protein